MSYKKNKVESYQNLGGINQKASAYNLNVTEVLDLVNYDFQEPGAWTKRPGVTAALMGNTFVIGSSQIITDIWQINTNGSARVGASFGQNPLSQALVGFDSGLAKYNIIGPTFATFTYSTLTTNATLAVWNHTNYKDFSYITSKNKEYISFIDPTGQDNSPFTYKYGPAYVNVTASVAGAGPGTGVTFFEQETFGYFGLPKPFASEVQLFPFGTPGGDTFSGTYSYKISYVDPTGFIGPKSDPITLGLTVSQTEILLSFSKNSVLGSSYVGGSYAAMPNTWAIFRNRVAGYPSAEFVLRGIFYGNESVGTLATLSDSNGDKTALFAYNQGPVVKTPGIYETPVPSDRPGQILQSTGLITNGNTIFTRNPSIMEIYQNRLFINGDFNTIEFSEIDDPQNIQPESNFQVTFDRYVLKAMKNYNQSLIIFLQKGVFRLTGDNADNFNLQQMTTEYGCISQKSVVVFREIMWFIDEKGIVQFNGANFELVSNRVEHLFLRMNLAAAYDKATAVHHPERNEVWFSIPIDGSNINNIIIVYDYLVNAFTTFSGDKIKPTALAPIYYTYGFSGCNRYLENKRYVYGSIGGSLYYFGDSFQFDDGQGITLSFQTRNHNDAGKSTTSQFRRFYLDLGGYSGPTLNFSLNFYANYATQTISLTRAMIASGNPQDRIDYGIPAKALSIKATHGSTNSAVKIYGYTIESRFQRSV